MNSAGDLPHARWIISHLSRDPDGCLVISPDAVDIVRDRARRAIEDDSERDAFVDQVVGLAHGAWTRGGEIQFARSLVALLLEAGVPELLGATGDL